MALFDLIVGTLFVVTWSAIGIVPWLAVSVITRGHAGMAMLPLCMLASLAGGMLVPFLGFTAASGIWLSFIAALALSSLTILARRFAGPAFAFDATAAEVQAPETK